MKIFVQFDADTCTYDLMCNDGMMRSMPAGPRLFRAPPHPDVKFSGHEDMTSAETDAELVRKYLVSVSPRRPTKKELRAVEA